MSWVFRHVFLGILCLFIILCTFLLLRSNWSDKMSVLKPIIVNATSKHSASLIFLHGLGDTGHGWSAGFESLGIKHMKYICPNAPSNPVTLNGGFIMPSWFDIATLGFPEIEDEEGIKKAAAQIKSLVEEEIKSGTPAERIVLGGFSQGGALALYTAFTMEKTLGGILALSCWLPLHNSFPGCIKGNRDTPVFQGHGNVDPVIQVAFGDMTNKYLASFCSKLEYKKYADLSHSSGPQEMQDVKDWLNKVVPPTD